MSDRPISLPAIVLAGGEARPELQAGYLVSRFAEVPIAGKAMVQRVLDALNASSHVDRICVVGDIQCEGAGRIVPPVGSFLDNLVAGLKACESAGMDGRVLVSTADIPLVTSEAIDDFIERCGDLDADFYYPVVPKEASERRLPGMRRTYTRLAEGTFTGGNIVVMNARFVTDNTGLISEVLEARKSVTRLARLIGLRVLLRVVIAKTLWPKAIDIALLEKTVGRVFNAKVRVVQTPFPEIGADVDDLEQLEQAESALGGPTSEGDPE